MATDPQTDGADSSISQVGSTRNDRKRNLVNQRNFRSRRKQYIEELEGKVQAYERQGVAASQQVQDAARALIAENEALRHIIFQQLGWRPEYLNAVISQPVTADQQHHQQQFKLPGITSDPLQHTLSARNYEPVQQRMKDEPRLPSYFATNGQASGPPPPPSAPQRPHEYGHGGDQYDHTNGTMDHRIDDPNRNRPPNGGSIPGISKTISETNGHGHVPRQSASFSETKPATVMSCEHAASILAEIRTQGGVGNVDAIRAELGCKTTEACDVPHDVVFERMDRAL